MTYTMGLSVIAKKINPTSIHPHIVVPFCR